MEHDRNILVLSAVRTAIGKYGGGLAAVPPCDLAATVVGQAVSRAQHPVGDRIGLTVNAVTPGYIATDMMATIPDKVLDRIRTQIPVGRLGAPEEIARVVAFLAADASAYITGQIWAVNGGLDM